MLAAGRCTNPIDDAQYKWDRREKVLCACPLDGTFIEIVPGSVVGRAELIPQNAKIVRIQMIFCEGCFSFLHGHFDGTRHNRCREPVIGYPSERAIDLGEQVAILEDVANLLKFSVELHKPSLKRLAEQSGELQDRANGIILLNCVL